MLRQFGQFAVNRISYPYDNDEIAKITARIIASYLGFNKKESKVFKRARVFICSEYVWECYQQLGICIKHDSRGFIAPTDSAKAEEVTLLAELKLGHPAHKDI